MTTPTDAPQDPAGPQPVMQPGAIDDATVPDPELDGGGDAPVFDPVSGDVAYEPRP